ncbi:hypothetical protein GGX14DRAFT_558897 [Mycena pura]|uniref:Uncharacterized protein n=1 Tax=Mycena pura TaxID=153505 RepID=A0AAD6VX82_9AGAR|nr:hypothetical protein GGX14DRAFT_558897 [Mycena pura]
MLNAFPNPNLTKHSNHSPSGSPDAYCYFASNNLLASQTMTVEVQAHCDTQSSVTFPLGYDTSVQAAAKAALSDGAPRDHFKTCENSICLAVNGDYAKPSVDVYIGDEEYVVPCPSCHTHPLASVSVSV